MNLLFDAEKHEYSLDGARLPHVTGVLEEMGLTPRYPAGPYRVRGHRVHQATVLFDSGELDQYDIGADLMPYVQRYKILVAELNPTYQLTEEALYHPTLCYAGTVDRAGMLFSKYRFIGDIKTGETGPETGLQTAAYAMMVDPVSYRDIQRYTFSLAKGNGRLIKHEDPDDYDAWVAILTHWKWLQKKRSRSAGRA